MPLLQVRDFPEELYALLTKTAQNQNRSIAQQVVFLIKNSFSVEQTNKSRRCSALNGLSSLCLNLKTEAPSPSAFLREDRDYTPAYIPDSLSKSKARSSK